MTNQLLVSEKNAITSLPLSLQEFAMARQEPPINTLKPNEVKRACAEVLTKASFDMGSPMANEAQVLKFQTEALFLELGGKFGNMTLSELRSAFNKGIRGEFGQFFGMCPATYNKFIKSYFELPARGQAQIEYLNLLAGLKTTEVPIQIKTDISKNGCLRIFKIYKETGKFELFPWKYYDMLNDLIGVEYKGFKTLITDPAKRKEIFEKTEGEYKKQLLQEKERAEKRGRLSDAEAIKSRIAMGFENDEPLKNKQKTLMLKMYFDGLIANGKELEL